MTEKIRVALIFKEDYTFFNPSHFDNTTYYFFMHALKRNEKIDITYYPSKNYFDCQQLKNKTDVILLPNNKTDGTPDELAHIQELDIPVICRTGDPHWAKRDNQFEYHEKWKIDYYFNFMSDTYFHKFYPKNYNYKEIMFGIEPNLYTKLEKNYDSRIKNKILNSGALGKTNLKSRIANKILNPNRSSWYFYKLRTLCNDLDYVIHTKDLQEKYHSDNYPKLLSRYFSAISATTFYPTIKYWETTAAGCLTFMEITELNNGIYLGFEDGKNAIFINENNYEKKFLEFLSDAENPKWIDIAKSGQDYSLTYFNNDTAVKNLVNLMNELIIK